MSGWHPVWRSATALLCALVLPAQAQTTPQVVDIATRPGVTQRLLVLATPQPRATVVLLAGGHGGLQVSPDGAMRWGAGNFLVRSRQLFVDQGLLVVVVDAPSDRQSPPYLNGFRQTPGHVADLRAVIAWARGRAQVPVWLVGTSRGTESAAYVATELTGADGPDGVVLSATLMTDPRGRPVPAMPLDKIRVPVLLVHHEQDGCAHCAFSWVPTLQGRLAHAPRTGVLSYRGGESRGDPCEAFAFHGFNGIEAIVVQQTAAWVLAK